MIRLDNVEKYTENNRIEAKKAAGGLPQSLWETYSAFANTFGGIILLGVEELPDHTLRVSGISQPEKMIAEFWEILKNHKYVSANILSADDVYISETGQGKMIVIQVPRARRQDKPIFLGEDPYRGTYRRCGEGDYHCTRAEVDTMLRDRENWQDQRPIQFLSLEALDLETVARYRQKFLQQNPGHQWNALPDIDFLQEIGAAKQVRGVICPTAAGLLMFGWEQEIVKEFPGYFLDYREKKEEGANWDFQIISGSGDWSGNLCDFYFCVCDQITAAITAFLGHAANGKTPMREAIREAVANAVIHADYNGGAGLVIEKTRNSISITNPGNMRVSPDLAAAREVSDQRNATLAKMFALVGVGRGRGGGLHAIETVWEQYHWGKPSLREQFNPDMVTLHLTIETDFTNHMDLQRAAIEYLTDHIEGDGSLLARNLRISKEKAEAILRALLLGGVIVPGENGRYQLKR